MPYDTPASFLITGPQRAERRGKMREVIEIIRTDASAAKAKVVIFDFDGTLSLIRSGWMDVMVPMCVEQLAALRQRRIGS